MRTILTSIALSAAALLLCGGCESMGNRATTLNVPLTYRPTSHINGPSNLGGGKVYIAPVVDQRADKEKIGENIEDEGKPARTVLADGESVTRFVRDAFTRELTDSGVAVSDVAAGSDHTLTITLRRLFCTEENTYRTDASVTIDVSGRGQAFSGTYSGHNTRFGRSYSAGNYQETYSDALVELMDKMFEDAEFRKALTAR